MDKSKLLQIFAAFILSVLFVTLATGQLAQLPPPPSAETTLLRDIFRATKTLQESCRAIEFKERVSFRLAAVVVEDRTNRNVDFRQSADYSVTIRPGQPPERKFLQSTNNRRYGSAAILKKFDIAAIQETLPTVATLQTALLNFVTSEYVNGYKQIGHEKIKNHRTIKMELRFRPGRFPVEQCVLWIDEEQHIPLRAELRIGAIGRYGNVSLAISYDDWDKHSLPTVISQELQCNTFELGVPLRLEHIATYSELKPLPPPN
ncbi:MAG: hypothetical protein AB1489_32595 [Acidobacteriota bacterium]